MRRGYPRIAVRVIADAVAADAAIAIAYWFRFHVYPPYIPSGEPPDANHYLAAAPIVAAALVLTFAVLGEYRLRRGVEFIDELFSLVGAMAVTALVIFAMIGLYREPGFLSYSRLTFAYWIAIATVLVIALRYSIRRFEASRRARGTGVERALVVGWGEAANLLVQRIRMFPDYGYRLVGVLSEGAAAGPAVAGVPVLGTVDDLREIARAEKADVAFVSLPHADQDRVVDLIEGCRDLDLEFRILPSMLELMTTNVMVDSIDGIPLLQLKRPLDVSPPAAAFKRGFDVLLSAVGLVLLSPVLAVVALAVRVSSPGPVLLHQERVGVDGVRFRMHKFRTMRQDAESDTGPVWAAAEDPRRTRVGRFLRRFSLDELPQLWNILRGEMSLVGPRAERPHFVAEFTGRVPRYGDRLAVRPGLTGWAQANDLRGQTPVEDRTIYDVYYIENWSIAFDLKILLLTLVRVFTHRNAY